MYISKDEVMRYLGYKGGTVEQELDDMIESAIAEIIEVAAVRSVFRIFDIDRDMNLGGSVCRLEGGDIAKHLKECSKCVLMAVTLGMDVENLIRKAQISDMAKALILDAAATAAVESVCDELEAEIAKEYRYITSRFSPGYGDMPLKMQKSIAAVLDTARRIGLTVTDTDILLPRKSVTAIIGISENEINKEKRSCESCNLKETCSFRKEGKACGE